MKQISEAWHDLGAGRPSTKSSEGFGERANRVWASLTAVFGDRFSREFGSEPSAEWAAAVAGLRDIEITNGLKRLAEEGRAHPPNLSEFVAACRKAERPREIHSAPKLLEMHSGVSPLCRTGLLRIGAGHPEYRGSIADPHSLPGRPRGVDLIDWLKGEAPEDIKAYCRAGVEWSRRNKAIALPGFMRLVSAIELRGDRA